MNLCTKSVMSVKIASETLAYLSNMLCYIIVGYEFSQDMFGFCIPFTLITIVVSYIVRVVIILTITVIINSKKKRPIGSRLQALLVFGGVRGPRSFAMVVDYNNAPYSVLFKSTQLHLIVFSVVVDTLITKLIIRSIRKKLEKLKDKHVTVIPLPDMVETKVDGCMNWLLGIEAKFQKFLVSNKDELKEEVREAREKAREEAIEELDKMSFKSIRNSANESDTN